MVAPWMMRSRARRYGALERHLQKRGYKKIEWITASLKKVFVASGRAPKDLVDGDSELERETIASEHESV